MIYKAPDNSRGCKCFSYWDCMDGVPPLEDQIKAANIDVVRTDMPHFSSWAGRAYLLHYTSKKTGDPLVVLCMPSMYAPDAWGETYFYFPATVFAEYPAEQWWIDAFDELHAATRDLRDPIDIDQ